MMTNKKEQIIYMILVVIIVALFWISYDGKREIIELKTKNAELNHTVKELELITYPHNNLRPLIEQEAISATLKLLRTEAK